jgi:hypothetical protein
MLALLQAAESVYVNFDPRRDGVIVPPQLKRQPRVVLQYGMNMAIPIPDLDVGEEGIGATLSFDRMPTWTFVPWSAVFAIVSQDQRGMLWEADVPREVQVEQKKPPPSVAPSPPAEKAPASKGERPAKGKAKRPSLRAVEGGQRKTDRDEGGKTARAAKEDADATAPRGKPSVRAQERAAEAPPPSTPDKVEGEKASDEIVEPPRHEKKKRELPPYLRVVK